MTPSHELALAFYNKLTLKRSVGFTDGNNVWLHKSRIAWRNEDGSVSVTLAGWGTRTTRDYVNSVCWVCFGERPFYQRDHQQCFKDDEISSMDVFTLHTITPTPDVCANDNNHLPQTVTP